MAQDVQLAVQSELQRQDIKWGEQNHNAVEWIAILGEEFGEAAKEAVEFHYGRKGSEDLIEELIQVAATAIQAAQSLQRQKC